MGLLLPSAATHTRSAGTCQDGSSCGSTLAITSGSKEKPAEVCYETKWFTLSVGNPHFIQTQKVIFADNFSFFFFNLFTFGL